MPAVENNDPLDDVARYYTGKLAQHGNTPQGVDWNGEESQAVRFAQLYRIVEGDGPFSLNDIGCGYGALLDFLIERGDDIDYTGIDISEPMVNAARRRHQDTARARFATASRPPGVADYSVASGILNVKLGYDEAQWQGCVDGMLEVLDTSSRRGFAFNCLTSYSDTDRMRDYLFYADPCRMFDHCKRRYSRQVALLHDYGLYEFTILVRKLP